MPLSLQNSGTDSTHGNILYLSMVMKLAIFQVMPYFLFPKKYNYNNFFKSMLSETENNLVYSLSRIKLCDVGKPHIQNPSMLKAAKPGR